MGRVGVGPFQSQILAGTQQLFVGNSEAGNPPSPRSASYSLTHSTAWVNSDSSAQAAPCPNTNPHTGMATAKLCLSPKPTPLISAPCGHSPKQGWPRAGLRGGFGKGGGAPVLECLGMFTACPASAARAKEMEPSLAQEQGVCCPWSQCCGQRGGQGVHTWQGKLGSKGRRVFACGVSGRA